ncbi:YidC/Oxa1 family membrane protein insertase [Acetilactobacillus jinshanensis]|uniref:Membrane protein insertase YidC n=1 Tax=Acetilactobacillus jinshanensis TaxID=1720083 RepID=A0A4P6ZNG9_9LACO|nr:YidC/Oxa1 family membrane protein insertase [Acetilactobacillus jinshanensis]QBP18972.1 membrane protein insertase YidC [Acetilactobacillus jinshanensis]URL60480.1 membrane protein insertase YidC [uncultured bacterium]
MKKKFKKWLSLSFVFSLMLFLTACSNKPITEHSTGLWDGGIVLNFSRAILWLSKTFGHSYGMGIIVFTIIVRIIILPLMIYQLRTMRKTQKIAPQLKALQKKYSSHDTETMEKLRTAQQKLYSEAGVNPLAGCLPLLVQLPILWALYQSIWRTHILRTGQFLWLRLGSRDPYLLLPILAAVFTFFSVWLSTKSQMQMNGMSKMMMIGMPIFIFFAALNIPSALSLYWVVTNAFSAVQILIFQNPWKIRKERSVRQRKHKAHERKIRKAIRRATRSKHNHKNRH